MLTKLTITNYALINHLEVSFHTGLNSVTGETGAGKSIILGAMGLILGNRADLSVLKERQEKCIVEGVFSIKNYHLQPFFRENDLDYDDLTILRREITPAGKSRAFINDTPVNLKTLEELGIKLIDIHSQHQNLELTNRKFQLELVDAVAGNESLKREYQNLFARWLLLQKELQCLMERSEKEQAELDYWQFQFNQLEEARLADGEQEELEHELEQLTHAEEIKSALTGVRYLLDNEQLSIITNLKQSMKLLETIHPFLPEVKSFSERMQSATLELKDLLDELESAGNGIEHDPDRIEAVNDRLSLIYGLQQKHHATTIGELIQLKNNLEEKINQVTGYEEEISALHMDTERCKENAEEVAAQLRTTRKAVFDAIEKAIRIDLQQLGMPKSRFEILHEALPELTGSGKDSVSFLFSANIDSLPTDISKVASGGEMSRLMLAVKNLLRTARALPTVIFDEIDAGISGEIALKMGSILKTFASTTQIINITHLPQIAAKGDAHYRVFKREEEGRTVTSMVLLNERERIEELAQMVGGEQLTETTIKTAEELLNN